MVKDHSDSEKLLFKNTYIWFILKHTFHNYLHNHHISLTNDIFKQIIELWWLVIDLLQFCRLIKICFNFSKLETRVHAWKRKYIKV